MNKYFKDLRKSLVSGGVIFTKLVSVRNSYIMGGRFISYIEIDYVDLYSSTTLYLIKITILMKKQLIM